MTDIDWECKEGAYNIGNKCQMHRFFDSEERKFPT
jgi:hypothetical protein